MKLRVDTLAVGLTLFLFVAPGGSGLSASTSSEPKIYFADTMRIVRIGDMTGAGWITYGSAGSARGQFKEASAIAVDSRGRIYVIDNGNNRIVRINDMSGTGWTEYELPASGQGRRRPYRGIAVDRAGRVYFGDASRDRVVRIDDMTGKGRASLGGPASTHRIIRLDDIALDRKGRLYVLDHAARVVRVDDISGAGWHRFGPDGVVVTDMHSITSIATDASGHIYGTDVNDIAGQLVRWSWNGIDDENPYHFDAHFDGNWSNSLTCVTVDASGRIYAIDEDKRTVYRMNDIKGRALVSFAGKDSQFAPAGMAVR